MTGLSDTDQIIRGFASGGVDYVVKPLRIPEVLVRLATHVRNARATRQAQEAVDVAGLGGGGPARHGPRGRRPPPASRLPGGALSAPPLPPEPARGSRGGRPPPGPPR